MRFLIISNLYEPYARGGAEAVVKMTAEGLVRAGHAAAVLTAGSWRAGLWPRETTVNGVRVLRFFPLNIFFVRHDRQFPLWLRAVMRWFDIWNFHAALVGWAMTRRERPDLIIIHNLVGLGMLTSWAVRCGWWQKKRPTIKVLHDLQLIHPSGLLLWGKEKTAERFWLRKIYEWLMRHLAGSFTAVIAPSRWLLEFHTQRGFFPKSKKMVLPNPVDFIPTKKKLPVTGYQLPVTLLYAGQLEEHKGVRWLLELFGHSERSEESPADAGSRRREGFFGLRPNDYVLEIAGEGSLRKEVEEAAAQYPEAVIYHGKLSRGQLFHKFQEIDALVVPSLCYENAPQVIAEALAAGLAVIASRIGGIPELVRDGENGFLFTPADQKTFFEALARLSTISNRLAIRDSSQGLTVDQYIDKLISLC
ncbi:glycosyltransferase [Candidatus Uhrbacteria bacterium]|nr:glycosyltransferase [Candidatus Uhrbacteria bacterium]